MPDPHVRSDSDDEVAALALPRRAALTNGSGPWHTEADATLGLPSIMMTDGPHGLRKQRAEASAQDFTNSEPSTCFPPAVGLASSWDSNLVHQVGAAIGREAKALGVSLVLGPGINMKRSPLCGRNFEYFSEDPVVAGVLGAAMVDGLQEQGVGASLKHFAANNQEHDRMRVSADIDPRPLREIYLRAFEHVVRSSQPWTVMCSYNGINGVPAAENEFLLTQILRTEWGFEGVVVSDWGAVGNPPAAIAAGLDLQMPGSAGIGPQRICDAVAAGTLDEAAVTRAAQRVVGLVRRAQANLDPSATVDLAAHHQLARTVAADCVVLLKNSPSVLPLANDASVAVIGELARTPRYQGAGSSQIQPTELDNLLDSVTSITSGAVEFAPGYSVEDLDDDGLVADAVALAQRSSTVVCCVGLPSQLESEGFDRTDMELPAVHRQLLDGVIATGATVIVVLVAGGVVRVGDVADRVPAIIAGHLLGQGGGSGLADVLFGRVNPSGRLAETVPKALSDNPSYLNFPGEHGHVRYGEGLFIGYRWYDVRDIEVEFAFGHGLSYTHFEHTGLTAEVDGDEIVARLRVGNIGERDGREVVQLYLARPDSAVIRPKKELAAFTKVSVPAGETREVELRIGREQLRHWDTRIEDWVVEGGPVQIIDAASAAVELQQVTVDIVGDEVRVPLTESSTLGEVLTHPIVGPLISFVMPAEILEDTSGFMMMMRSMPMRQLVTFGGLFPEEIDLDEMIALANSQE
ncbi:glycoside hydrolase family 3 C-terminal domain-containing protein [Williamsia sp. CHRR-6]|uniref:glycoside hydrolase family 3 C-terminal domain-containing protein n=1 Tax=Williamsia sp. CHRR-6 TaxID=2835871 RepID=UPI001BDA96AB|nr:glycoside hydrolase family 3 C-terminal domain-containing protein [Williamsia sp. CHRR-6]MBT0568670.1 glycoside hydrolase family 3 C-terminal domain-containing protein [Williamsia sp. CHRR-6]